MLNKIWKLIPNHYNTQWLECTYLWNQLPDSFHQPHLYFWLTSFSICQTVFFCQFTTLSSITPPLLHSWHKARLFHKCLLIQTLFLHQTVFIDPGSDWILLYGFYCATLWKRGIGCCHLSVCLSVTSLYCIKTAIHRITQTMPHNSPGTLVFSCQTFFWNSNGVTPNGGAKGKKLANFDK